MRKGFESTKCYLWLFLLLFGTLGLTYINGYYYVNILFLLVFSLLLFLNRKTIIFIFIALLPTNGFISTGYNLYGIIHTTYIIYFFSFLAFLLEWRSLPKNKKLIIGKNGKINNDFVIILLFYFLYSFSLNIKKDILGLEEVSTLLYLTRFFRLSFLCVSLFFVLKLSRLPNYRHFISKGFIISLLLISLGAIFSNLWQKLGIYIGSDDVQNFGFEIRRSGFWGLSGDENSLAGYLAVGFAYALFNHKRNLLWILLVISFGLLSTGSRTGVLNIAIILLFYTFVRNIHMSSKLKVLFFFTIAVCFSWYLGYFNNIIARFAELETGVDSALDSSVMFGRVGGWLLYLKYILTHFSVLLFGTSESMYKALDINYYERVAHNFYIQVWYYWGIFALLFFLHRLKKISSRLKQTYEKNALLAIFIPFVITLFTVSDTGVFISFIIAYSCITETNIRNEGSLANHLNNCLVETT